MRSITLHNHNETFGDVNIIDDCDPWDAIEQAKHLFEQGYYFEKALVDRFDGLVLVGSGGIWHFSHALCGYEGSGPQATAEILEIFGFGKFAVIMARIDHGGNAAKATFYR